MVATIASGAVVGLGEAKHTTSPRGTADLARLEHIRSLLPSPEARTARLLLFSANGFDRNLAKLSSTRADVELIDTNRLYGK